MTGTHSEDTQHAYHLASGFVVLGADWVINLINVTSAGLSFWSMDLVAAALTAVTVASIENQIAGVPLGRAAALAGIAGVAVAVPLPVAGTLMALGIFVRHALRLRRKQAI